MILSDEQRTLLQSIWEGWNDRDVKHVVLRRHEKLPDEIVGGGDKSPDIDVFIPPNYLNDAVTVLREEDLSRNQESNSEIAFLVKDAMTNPTKAVSFVVNSPERGIEKVKRAFKSDVGSQSNTTLYDIACEQGHTLPFYADDLVVDIKIHLSYESPMNGRRYRVDPFVEKSLLLNREPRSNYFVPAPEDELAHLIPHCVYDKGGEFPTYYIDRCKELLDEVLADENREERFQELLDRIFFAASSLVFDSVREERFQTLFNELKTFDEY